MVENKATQICLTAQSAYPEYRRPTLLSSPPIGYLLRIERETEAMVYRCIYSLADGRKIHTGACAFDDGTPGADEAEAPAAGADRPLDPSE